jgi:hypothetical protein
MPAPSRQERRKAERDAAKRAPAKAGAGGAAANVSSVGDWTSQVEDHNVLFRALGFEAGAYTRSQFSST